jgi:tetratricopeptide (TPR) repeat protein
VLSAAHRREEAQAAYQQSLAILEEGTVRDPGHSAWWQGKSSLGYAKFGVAFAAAGRREEALEAYRKVLALPSPEFLKEEVNQSIKKLKGRGWLGWFR